MSIKQILWVVGIVVVLGFISRRVALVNRLTNL